MPFPDRAEPSSGDEEIPPEQLYETFYVKLSRSAGPMETERTVRSLASLPGVGEAFPVTPAG
ncbi:hypothetical protein GCM10010156_66730 [Planobispora rosea]|uniref:Uncharacterized protein n=1 Tax=Planobispora rosea TaxID=35762 RepID=A0A8J3S792_PLARO|nr:hypothetical protein [Planobispora rosea]GGS99327.1 hypothetical protein GCM10010156_66730 [Planobispora rosea]GIH88035.1 hypothetical protein Pro02_64430 [Planobispora rosea]